MPISTLTGIALYYYPKAAHALHPAVYRRKQQSRPARPAGAMALSAHAGLYLARAWPLVRHLARREETWKRRTDFRQNARRAARPPDSITEFGQHTEG